MATKGHPRIYLLAAIVAAACFSTSAARAAEPDCSLSAPDISKKVHRLSAKELTTWLYANNSAEMSQLAVCVATAEEPWLDIAATVLQAAPEDSGDDLTDALASALKVNAQNVIGRRWSFSLDLICHVSDEDIDSYGHAIQSLDLRIKNLDKIKRADLKSKAQDCIDALNANKKWMAQSFGIDSADDDNPEVPPAPNPGTAPPAPDPGTAPPPLAPLFF